MRFDHRTAWHAGYVSVTGQVASQIACAKRKRSFMCDVWCPCPQHKFLLLIDCPRQRCIVPASAYIRAVSAAQFKHVPACPSFLTDHTVPSTFPWPFPDPFHLLSPSSCFLPPALISAHTSVAAGVSLRLPDGGVPLAKAQRAVQQQARTRADAGDLGVVAPPVPAVAGPAGLAGLRLVDLGTLQALLDRRTRQARRPVGAFGVGEPAGAAVGGWISGGFWQCGEREAVQGKGVRGMLV